MAQSTQMADLHVAMKKLCGDGPGFFVPTSTLNRLLERALSDAVRELREAGLQMPPSGVRLRPVLGNAQPAVQVAGVSQGGVKLGCGLFDLAVELFQEGFPANVLSLVRYRFPPVEFLLESRGFDLVVRAPKERSSSSLDTTVATRAATIVALGWDTQPDALASFEQFERFVAFAGGQRILDLLADAMRPPQIVRAFSGLDLRGPMVIEPLTAGPLGDGIALVPQRGSGFAVPPCTGCLDGDSLATVVEIVDYETQQARWDVVPSGSALPGSNEGEPDGLGFYAYVPLPVFEETFGPQAYPAVSFGDSGTLGPFSYEWSGVVGMKQVAVELDLGRPGFLVRAAFAFSLRAAVWIPLPCDERQEVGRASLTGEITDVRIRSAIRLDRGRASLRLESVLENHLMGPLDADIDLLGWPLDAILDRVLEHNAPGLISAELAAAIRRGRLELASLGALQASLPYRFEEPTAFRADADALLIGIFSRG